MQALAQVENAQGKHDEASWAFFPNFQTTAYVGGPTQEHRSWAATGTRTRPIRRTSRREASAGGLHGTQGVQMHVDVQATLPVWTFGKDHRRQGCPRPCDQGDGGAVAARPGPGAYDVARAYWGYQTSRNAEAAVQKVRTRLKDAQETARKLLAQKSEQISRADAMKLDYLAEEIEAQHARR